ncbi:MAG: hypothetical protein AB3N13_03690 [Arenibacterium sp.]
MAAKPNEAVKALKADISAARKRDMNFAVCMGKKPENTLLKIDRKREGSMLAKMARKEGETAKVAFGTLQADGNKLNFTCTEGAPTGLAKSMKRLMHSLGLSSYKVRLIDAEGGVLEEDGEDEVQEDSPAPDATQEAAPEAPDAPGKSQLETLADAYKELEPQVEAAKALGDKIATQVMRLSEKFLNSVEQEKTGVAVQMLDMLRGELAKMPADAGTPEDDVEDAGQEEASAPDETQETAQEEPDAPAKSQLDTLADAYKELESQVEAAKALGDKIGAQVTRLSEKFLNSVAQEKTGVAVQMLDMLRGELAKMPADAGAPEDEDEEETVQAAEATPPSEPEPEDDASPEDAQSAEPEPDSEPTPDQMKDQWLQAQVKIKRALNNQESEDPRVAAAFDKIKGIADSGDFKTAITQAGKLLEALEKKAADAGAAVAAANEKKWLALEPRIREHVEQALAGKPDNEKKITVFWNMVLDKANSTPPDHAGAIKATAALVNHLKQAVPTVEVPAKEDPVASGEAAPAASKAAADDEEEEELQMAETGGSAAPAAPEAAADDEEEEEELQMAETGGSAAPATPEAAGDDEEEEELQLAETDRATAQQAAGADEEEEELQLAETGGSSAPEAKAEGDGPEPSGGDAEGDGLEPAGEGGEGDGVEAVEFAMSPAPEEEKADLSGDDAAKLARIENELSAIDKLIDAYMAVIPGSAETKPATWTKTTSENSAYVTAMKDPAAVLETKKLDGSLKDLTKLKNTVNAKTVEKKDWKQARGLFMIGLDILDDHPQSTEPEIQPKISAIKGKLAAADAQALAQDFKKAIKALEPLAKECAELEVLADQCAHYKAILAMRQAMVASTIGSPATGDAKIDAMQAQCQDLLNKAAADAAADKFEDAVKKLDAIPELHTEMRKLTKKMRDYNTEKGRLDAVFAAIDPMPRAQRDLMEPELENFRKRYRDNLFATTKDYEVSANQYLLLRMKEGFYFRPLAASIRTYFPVRTAFDAQLAAFEGHPGKKGIEQFILDMKADRDQADGEVTAKRFATATGLLNRSKPDWPTALANAVNCQNYDAKLAALKPKLDAIRSEIAAATAVAQADSLFSTAATQTVSGDYTGALNNLTEAEQRIQEGEAAVKAANDLAALKDNAALDGIAADFAKAYKVFTDMKANVSSQDTTSTFTSEIDKSDTPAAAAQTAASASPADFTEARAKLDEAIGIVETILPKIIAWGPYQAHLLSMKNTLNPGLSGVNIDDCIKGQITDATKLVTDAEALAKAPGFDIAGAEAKLLDAKKITDQAAKDAALHPKIKTDLVDIRAQKTALELPANAAVLALMTDRKKTIDDYLTEIPADIAARKMADASRKAAAGAALRQPTTDDISDGIEALRRKVDWYDPLLAKVKDHDICKDLIAKSVEKLKVYTDDLAVPNFLSAQSSINPPCWDLQDAEKLYNDSLTFEPLRLTAELALKGVRAVRNVGVEAELLLMETRYTTAIATGNGGNFHRATIEMKEVIKTCGLLAIKALAFKPYEDARIPAKAKLDEATAHANASAIQPMIDRLTQKYADGVAKADALDYDVAKAMMNEVEADAKEAIQSADDAAQFATAMGLLDKAADTGILPSGVILVTQKVYDRLAARPEATSAQAELTAAQTQLTAAKAGGSGAKAALKSAIASLEAADEKMSQYRMLEQSFKRAMELVGKITGHAQSGYMMPLVLPVQTELMTLLPDAIASGDMQAASQKLEGYFTKLNEYLQMADDYATYLTKRADPAGEPILDKLEKHDHRYAIKPSIDSIRKKLADADKLIAEHKVQDALKLIEEVHKLGLSANMLADMRNNDKPSPADVQKILERPGGAEELDAMIDQLEPDAAGEVLKVVFEARFGCKLQMIDAAGNPIADANLSGTKIKQFYEAMTLLPDSDTLDNDSMLIWSDEMNNNSKYRSSEKKVIMNEGSEDEFNGAYGFGRDFEVGGQKEECKPVDMEPVSRFNWNTLHEVGHAVDDKKGYMDKNGKSASHGGWQVHGRDYGPISKAISEEYKYDQTYVEEYMLKKPNIARPEVPSGVTEEEWERRRVNCENHVKLARKATKPWNSNAQAEKIAIKGRVYQEAYDNSWNSYLIAARKEGMTGYQFRAPGEWFSELYAAYHIGKMKPGHPAVSWIETLEKP